MPVHLRKVELRELVGTTILSRSEVKLSEKEEDTVTEGL
ncbi:MAG: hypothetical protein JWM59_4479, partial [Verrucomicrobiales bacterium]|nr:hypothetical protein [Verrucomicrobiales bacterium]